MNIHIGSYVLLENERIRIMCSVQGFSNSNVFFGPFIVVIKNREGEDTVRSSSLGVFTRTDPEYMVTVI